PPPLPLIPPSPTIIDTLSLHDALPISANAIPQSFSDGVVYLGFNNLGSVQGFQQRDHAAKLAGAINYVLGIQARIDIGDVGRLRSEEHTSELQSRFDLVCRLLLDKKKK